MRKILLASAFLAPLFLGAAHAQVPVVGPCYNGVSCDLGTGALTANGGTLSNGASGTSATAALTLKNSAGIGFQFVPQIGAADYNPLVSANDQAIITGASVGANNVLTLAPWSTTKSGLRLLGTGAVYSANNTLDDGSGNVLFHGAGAFRPAGNSGQVNIYGSALTGTYAGPGNNGYNCGGMPGLLTICADQDNANSNNAAELLDIQKYVGGSGTTGGRNMVEVDLTLNASTADTGDTFYQTIQTGLYANGNFGGSANNPLGHLSPIALYSYAKSGATNLATVTGGEFDIGIFSGASTRHLGGLGIVEQNAVAPGMDGQAFSVVQGGSVGALTCAFCVGTDYGGNPFAANGAVVQINPSGYKGAFGNLGFGDDYRLGTFASAAFASPGIAIGNASVRIGRSYLTDGASGLTINPAGSIGQSATLAAGGSGYQSTNVTGNDIPPLNLTDSYGGVWQATLALAPSSIAAPTLTAATSGGSLPSETVYVKVTYTSAGGETIPSAEASVAVTGPSGQVTVTSPASLTNATGYNVYAANAAGAEVLQNGATPIAIGTPYVINSLTTGTASPPNYSTSAISSVAMMYAPAVSGAVPSNPVTLNSPNGQAGSGATINVTWAAGTSVAVSGNESVSGYASVSGNLGGVSGGYAQGVTLGWNYDAGPGEADFVNNKGAGTKGGFLFLEAPAGTSVAATFGIGPTGHLRSYGTAPAVAACGTSPTVAANSTDTQGVVNVGSGTVTACTVTFANAYTVTPSVAVSVGGATPVSTSVSSVSTAGFTVNFSASVGSGTFDYIVAE